VDGNVRFRDDDYSADAMRAEGMKNIGDDRAMCAPYRFQKQFLQSRWIIQQAGIAPVEIGEHVAGEWPTGFHAIS
jgi:hypothetical protein